MKRGWLLYTKQEGEGIKKEEEARAQQHRRISMTEEFRDSFGGYCACRKSYTALGRRRTIGFAICDVTSSMIVPVSFRVV
jgi:hypothetical protein